MRRVIGLVLAAGASSRMGRGTNKLLEPVGGRPLLCWPVDALLESGIRPVHVVVGADEAAIRSALADRDVKLLPCDDWADGMGASLAHGLRAIGGTPAWEGVLVTLGDLPELRAETIEALVAAFEQAATDAICVPVHEGRRGHPVLFGSDHRDALSGLSGDRGARALLERHPARVIEVEVDSPGIFHDVDTPGDLARARRAR